MSQHLALPSILDFLFFVCDDNPQELPEQWKIMEKIRLVLEKYSKTLASVSVTEM